MDEIIEEPVAGDDGITPVILSKTAKILLNNSRVTCLK